jgi:hypothetical protein
LYYDVFGSEDNAESGDFQVEEVVPENQEDVDNLLLDLRRQGIIK